MDDEINKMILKKEILENGEYSCNIGITVNEWKEILKDKTFEKYLDTLMKFYAEHNHKSTCKSLGEKHNQSPHVFNIQITNFAKAVQKKLNRFEVIGTDGKPTFWIIPMIGRTVADGLFEWELRKELVEAIEKNNMYNMEYFNLTDENLAILEREIGKKYDSDNAGTLLYFDTRHKLKYLGWLLGQELDLELENNYSEKPNKQAGQGKGFVLKEYILTGFIPKKYYTQTKKNLFIKFVFWGFDICNPHFGINIDINFSDENGFKTLRDEFQQQSWSIPISEFPTNWEELVDLVKPKFKKMVDYVDSYFMKKEMALEMIPYIELLESNKNLILTGAPGTGKTYLAKKIAEEMNAEIAFVQFHPSYDYTDFVEGLRPVKKNGEELGFELRDGVFKRFCRKAINKETTIKGTDDNFDELYITFIDEVSESGLELETPSHKKKFKVEINSNKTCVAIPDTQVGTRMSITKEMIKDYIMSGQIRDWKPYTIPIATYFKEKYKVEVGQVSNEDRPYVIIIDEINRAEISKVFGELFFSIDPGYRGKNGRVKTQYSNLYNEGDVFKDGFYVPDNVYIIGTMNDIDRSVESFDFAMRRRFAWEEIKAKDRISMWNGQIDEWKDVAKKRMESLNKKIENIQGLGIAFHIGPAYFLKLNNYDGDFGQLWENHIKGVLFEYLRGFPESEKRLEELKKAYNLTTESQGDVQNNG